MELLAASLFGGCLAYLINEINVMQKDMKILLAKVAVLESLMHSRRHTDS